MKNKQSSPKSTQKVNLVRKRTKLQCEMCSKYFGAGYLKKHMRTKHRSQIITAPETIIETSSLSNASSNESVIIAPSIEPSANQCDEDTRTDIYYAARENLRKMVLHYQQEYEKTKLEMGEHLFCILQEEKHVTLEALPDEFNEALNAYIVNRKAQLKQ